MKSQQSMFNFRPTRLEERQMPARRKTFGQAGARLNSRSGSSEFNYSTLVVSRWHQSS
jgi:hypothetical protein